MAINAKTVHSTPKNKKGEYMKKPNKNTIETVKTIVISVLVTAIVAFVGGMKFQDHQQAMVNDAVKNVSSVTPVAQQVKK